MLPKQLWPFRTWKCPVVPDKRTFLVDPLGPVRRGSTTSGSITFHRCSILVGILRVWSPGQSPFLFFAESFLIGIFLWWSALCCWGILPLGSRVALRRCTWSAIIVTTCQCNINTRPIASRQNTALEWHDDCYERHLSVVLMLWLNNTYVLHVCCHCLLFCEKVLPRQDFKRHAEV